MNRIDKLRLIRERLAIKDVNKLRTINRLEEVQREFFLADREGRRACTFHLTYQDVAEGVLTEIQRLTYLRRGRVDILSKQFDPSTQILTSMTIIVNWGF